MDVAPKISDTVSDTATATAADTAADTATDTDTAADTDTDTVSDTAADTAADTATDTASASATDTASASASDTDPLGTFSTPLSISLVATSTPPFTAVAWGDTSVAPSDEADSYAPCAPEISERGHEVVYRLEIPADMPPGSALSVSLDEVPGDASDADVQLLDAPNPDACRARGNVSVSLAVEVGQTWWVAVDAWTNAAGVDLEGPFTITFQLAPSPAADPCLVNPLPGCGPGDAPLVNGLPDEPPGEGGCPPGMVRVDSVAPPAFCVDRWEAALVVVGAGGTLAPWSPYAHPGPSDVVRAVSAPGVVPQAYIDQVSAAGACQRAGKRLCSDAEWLRACRGAEGHTYPYGDLVEPGVCNGARACHPVIQYFGTAAAWVWSELDNPCLDQLPGGLAATGEYAGCVSADGVQDMVGNLHEWTANPEGTFRGGFFVDTILNGPGCLYATTAHNVWHWDYSTGFRCCAAAAAGSSGPGME